MQALNPQEYRLKVTFRQVERSFLQESSSFDQPLRQVKTKIPNGKPVLGLPEDDKFNCRDKRIAIFIPGCAFAHRCILTKEGEMNAEFEYLKRMAKWGGPEENQYDELNAVFQSINRDRKLGMIQDHEIETVWHSLPDVFYSLDTMQGFATVKPYGYPGDFEIVERIYHCWKSSNSHLVNWDHFFHAQMAPGAVRNRRHYYLNLLHSLDTTKQSKRVLDIACGPATSVIEFLSGNDGSVCFECVDFDKNAIGCASKKSQHVSNFVRFYCANAFHFASEHNFDLVWSAGLFDYLDDRAFKILLKKLLGFVAMDGELVLGNFSPENSTRDYMEFGNWHLIHRSADELIRLAKESGVPEEKISIRSEPLGVNLFLHITNE